MSSFEPRVSYIGIYPPTIARNAVALKGLRLAGVPVDEYVTEGKSWRKYLSLFQILRAHRTTTDVWLVGYLSGVAVPFTRLFGRKPVIYNAGNSFYESLVLDRARIGRYSFRAAGIWLLDWVSFLCSDLILAESESQKRFLLTSFGIKEKKVRVVLTGADNTAFFSDPGVEKYPTFCVGFRGGFLPATGVECIIDATELLKDEPIDFFLYGRGMLLPEIKERIVKKQLHHVHLDERFLDQDTLRNALLACHVLLGQFSSHPRLERTIQNKTFEALAMHMPFITLQTESNKELLTHGESAVLIEKAEPRLLAEVIKQMRIESETARVVAEGAARTYEEKASPHVIGRKLRQIIRLFLKMDEC